MKILQGFLAPWEGAIFIWKNKKMAAIAIVPFFINLFLLFLFFYFGYDFGRGLLDSWIHSRSWQDSLWAKLALGFIKAGLMIILLFFITLLYLTTAAIIAAPFNEMLTEMTEKKILGSAFQKVEYSFLGSMARVFHQELRKLILMLMVMLFSGILFLLPVIGAFLHALVNSLSISFFTGMEYLDFSQERRGFSLGQKIRYGLRHFFLTVGIGAATVFFLYIPLIFHFSAVGATIQFLKRLPVEPSQEAKR